MSEAKREALERLAEAKRLRDEAEAELAEARRRREAAEAEGRRLDAMIAKAEKTKP